MWLRLPALFFYAHWALAQKPSPCPNIFAYEPKGTENDRWYGRITVTTPDELNGIWLKITLDRNASLLGNWFGDTTSSDNKEFLIKNQQYHFQPNREPLSVRFFVKYNTGSSIPSLTSIRLNGRVICSESTDATASSGSETLHTSHQRPADNTNSGGSHPSYGSHHTATEATTTTTAGTTAGDDDYFSGDFSPWKPGITNNKHGGTQGSDSCGTVKVGARPLITHGESTNEGEWPWHIALYRYKGANMQYICGGSLISTKHMITAAHCVTKARASTAINPELLLAYLGKYNLYKLGNTVQSIQISKVTVHPEYSGTDLQNDLAILHLEQAAEITNHVRTVCLWEGDNKLHSIVERLGTVVGWGVDETGELSENLMMAKMPVVSTETCIFSNREFFSRFTNAKTLCAGFRNGTSACVGDSGGGMFFPRSGTSGASTVWQIRGVVSLSAQLQNEKATCDTSNYIVFTDVAKYIDWIRSALNT